MNRIERLYAITTILQTKRIVKGEDLAKKFDVSLRTIYRDIRSLEEGGLPIGAEAGIGYFLIDGYHLPPIMFTKAEGRALAMADKLIEKTTDSSVSKSFSSAMDKVKAVLDKEKKDELQGLEERILVNPFPFDPPEPQNMVLDQLKDAIIRMKVVEADYFSNYNGEVTKRKIEPIGLVYYSNHWHLIGFCQMRQDYRDFRTDRISTLMVLSEGYLSSKHPSLQQYIDKLVSETDLYRVKLRIQKSIYRYLSDSKYAMGLVEEENESDDIVTMTFATMNLDYIGRWLLMMLDKVEIMAPADLKYKVQYMVRSLNQYYEEISQNASEIKSSK